MSTEGPFIKMVNVLGYDVTMTYEKSFVDATIFGDPEKTYLLGMTNIKVMVKGPKGETEFDGRTIDEAKAQVIKWILE